MNEKKTAAQVHHHPNGEEEQLTLDSVLLPENNFTAGKPKDQGAISALLPSGAERAVSLRRLSEMAGLSERETRRAIQRERLQGAPICSDNQHGYYLAASEAERAAFCRSMRGRARQIIKAARAVEKGGGGD